MESTKKKDKFERGLEHFNAREFFEAHEVWEEIWLTEDEPEKTFLQGIIQIAAAFHHYGRGNPGGAETLLAAGIVKLTRFPADHRGLAIRELREEAKWWARNLGENTHPRPHQLPVIRRANISAARSETHQDEK